MRRRAVRLAAVPALLLAVTPPSARAAGPVAVLVIDGKGFGHGVGMAQDGAFWMGKSGATTAQILAQFYPGTKPGKSSGTVRVSVLRPTDGQADVAFPGGGEIRDAPSGAQSPGFPVTVPPGGHVRVHYDGARYWVEGGQARAQAQAAAESPVHTATGVGVSAQQLPTTTSIPTATTTTSSTTTTSTTAPPQTTSTTAGAPAPPPGPSSTRTLWAVPGGSSTTTVPATGRTYRGLVEATAARGAFELVDQLDVETYLRGMGEVRNPSWPAASLRAQATAARTYALRAMAANGELCDDQHCQVYLGAQAEYAAMDKAVSDTKGQVLVYGKGLASTVYSANGGAYSATRQEGFGTPDDANYPYLRAAPYPTQDPAPWTVKVALTDVAGRLQYKGKLTAVTVGQAGPSQRVLTVTLAGSAGTKAVTGLAFAKAFSLRSTLFTLRPDSADAAPPAPPEGDVIQAPPDVAFDPNSLPPDPLTPDEIQRAIPSPSQFTTAPTLYARARTVKTPGHAWPWLKLLAFTLLGGVAGWGGWHAAVRPDRPRLRSPEPPKRPEPPD